MDEGTERDIFNRIDNNKTAIDGVIVILKGDGGKDSGVVGSLENLEKEAEGSRLRDENISKTLTKIDKHFTFEKEIREELKTRRKDRLDMALKIAKISGLVTTGGGMLSGLAIFLGW